jgi:hypothetical protein
VTSVVRMWVLFELQWKNWILHLDCASRFSLCAFSRSEWWVSWLSDFSYDLVSSQVAGLDFSFTCARFLCPGPDFAVAHREKFPRHRLCRSRFRSISSQVMPLFCNRWNILLMKPLYFSYLQWFCSWISRSSARSSFLLKHQVFGSRARYRSGLGFPD